MFLDPAKLLVVLLVALIVLGPEKLPQVSRQIGAMWGDLRKWRARLESEMRETFPDLPQTHEVVQAVRSPLAFLDRLADAHESSEARDAAGATSKERGPSPAASNARPAGSDGEPISNAAGGEPAHNGANRAKAGGGPPVTGLARGGPALKELAGEGAPDRQGATGATEQISPGRLGGREVAGPGEPGVVPDDPSMN
jgi:sec-independent protein translocase protein TatB